MNNYEHIVMASPETVKNSRMIQSAVIEKSKRTKIKTTSVLSNFLGQKSCSEPKLIIWFEKVLQKNTKEFADFMISLTNFT